MSTLLKQEKYIYIFFLIVGVPVTQEGMEVEDVEEFKMQYKYLFVFFLHFHNRLLI